MTTIAADAAWFARVERCVWLDRAAVREHSPNAGELVWIRCCGVRIVGDATTLVLSGLCV